ncbi:aromatic ring-hydroxylating oxygenase subunit alpha [Mycobacterium heckeshornense]|uniref:Ring-hydroxylating oxygenase subunit alpha n=1 Tax=Mycobacterium heckeshornense TaxID=110505 RepID=A0A7R7TSK4_9MYCO|nr:aromatic ring-hydroxylating dioxygenase subunit alpha [Mycobacterium heckeshornense]MCV7036438.1 Rieske 2Fe-2S domain-containing protein [Mycobacterium heckeshornense]BCO34299.1 ring-hydroxylating oxygenase subunit alpha [Mycobacterium heckeshornense]BCQ07436.1 ring-hydroxylating oxygenase subunit alpha [Mycobacterium heckeshornense]
MTTLDTADAVDDFDVTAVVQTDRVHGSVYTSPEIFAREMDTIFKAGWVYVAHESEISEPGDYLTRMIGRDPVVVVRGKDGVVRVLLNRCTHRANKLCNAEKGSANSFRCPYHGWTFSNTGELQGVPMREAYGDMFKQMRSELGLAQAPRVDSYGGFIFASLAPQGISLSEHLGRATTAIDRLLNLSPSHSIDLRGNWMKHLHHANWKMVVENNVDGYHALFTHASVYDAIRPAKVSHVPSKVDVVVRDMGNGHSEIDYSNEYRKLDEEFVWYGRIPRDKLAEYVEALERAYGPAQAHDALVVGPPHTLIWPNLFLAEMNVMFVEPQAVDRTIAYTTAVQMPGQDKLNERTLRRSEGAMGPAGFLIADDGEIGMRNQAGLAAELPEWLVLSRGMDSDIRDETGIVNSDKSAETPQRGFYAQWAAVVGGKV